MVCGVVGALLEGMFRFYWSWGTHGRHGREVTELADKFLRDFKVTQYVRTSVPPSTFKKCVMLEQCLADRIQADRHENT